MDFLNCTKQKIAYEFSKTKIIRSISATMVVRMKYVISEKAMFTTYLQSLNVNVKSIFFSDLISIFVDFQNLER